MTANEADICYATYPIPKSSLDVGTLPDNHGSMMRWSLLLAFGLLFGGNALASTTLQGPFDEGPAFYTTIPNGTFEQGSGTSLPLWLVGGTTSTVLGRNTSLSQAGFASAGLVDPSYSNPGANISLRQTVSVLPGSHLVLSGWIHNGGSANTTAAIDFGPALVLEDDGGGVGPCRASSTSGHGDWEFVYCPFRVPANLNLLQVYLSIQSDIPAGAALAFDNIAITAHAAFRPPLSFGTDQDGDGFSTGDGDCDDRDPITYPGASDIQDGVDNDCNGVIDDGNYDMDNDGYCTGNTTCDTALAYPGDCDDTVGIIYPGAPEICDGLDDDCDGLAPNEQDDDGDGWFPCNNDCDDNDPLKNPNAFEACNAEDDDCDGIVDNPPLPTNPWWPDIDGDGYGDDASRMDTCVSPGPGWISVGGDCDDGDPAISPDAVETCNGIDDDCDEVIDNDLNRSPWYLDADGDGHGDFNQMTMACDAPSSEHVQSWDDCDDTNATIYPGAPEICDGLDQDCDSIADEGLDRSTWYPDTDHDGHGDFFAAEALCVPPSDDWLRVGDDCDDTDPEVYPGATEWCDGIDNDCDQIIDWGCATDHTSPVETGCSTSPSRADGLPLFLLTLLLFLFPYRRR